MEALLMEGGEKWGLDGRRRGKESRKVEDGGEDERDKWIGGRGLDSSRDSVL